VNDTAVQSEIQKASKWTLAGGILSICAGIVAIIVPAVASVTVAIFIGWILVFAGAVTFVDAFSVRSFGRIAVRLLLAVLTIGVGIYLLVEPLRGTYTLTVMLVIWFVAIGILRLVLGLAHIGQPGAGLLVFNGAVSLVLGILIGNNLPSSADWAIGLLVGIELIFAGITAIAVHSALKRSGDLPPPPSTPAFA
jgi:uncharacterized membrane protein HdeD (DUF308 family)